MLGNERGYKIFGGLPPSQLERWSWFPTLAWAYAFTSYLHPSTHLGCSYVGSIKLCRVRSISTSITATSQPHPIRDISNSRCPAFTNHISVEAPLVTGFAKQSGSIIELLLPHYAVHRQRSNTYREHGASADFQAEQMLVNPFRFRLNPLLRNEPGHKIDEPVSVVERTNLFRA
jgi:hypothetical protein